jgi:hypothetical protein
MNLYRVEWKRENGKSEQFDIKSLDAQTAIEHVHKMISYASHDFTAKFICEVTW